MDNVKGIAFFFIFSVQIGKYWLVNIEIEILKYWSIICVHSYSFNLSLF